MRLALTGLAFVIRGWLFLVVLVVLVRWLIVLLMLWLWFGRRGFILALVRLNRALT